MTGSSDNTTAVDVKAVRTPAVSGFPWIYPTAHRTSPLKKSTLSRVSGTSRSTSTSKVAINLSVQRPMMCAGLAPLKRRMCLSGSQSQIGTVAPDSGAIEASLISPATSTGGGGGAGGGVAGAGDPALDGPVGDVLQAKTLTS